MGSHTSSRRNSSLPLTLVSWSGWAAASSGLLYLVWGYAHRVGAPWHLDLTVLILGIVVPLLFLMGLAGLYVKCGPQAGWLGSIGFLISFAEAGWATIEGVKDAPNLYRHMGERSWGTHGVAQECGFCLLAKLSELLSAPLTCLLVGLSIVGLATVQNGVPKNWSLLLLLMALFGWIYQLTDDQTGLVNLRSVHVAFGLLFSLGWMVLGYALSYSVRKDD